MDREAAELADAELFEEEVDGAAEEAEAVANAERLVRPAETREVEGDGPVLLGDGDHHLAPEEGVRRPSVQQQHRGALSELPVREGEPVHLNLRNRRCGHFPSLRRKETDCWSRI